MATEMALRPEKKRLFNWTKVFGYDFFISFKLGSPPIGGQSYASDLARHLRELDFTVFFSEEEAHPGEKLDSALVNALNRSRILVVIANEGALLHSQWVRKEVEQFRAQHPKRPIIPINVDRAIEKFGSQVNAATWLNYEGRIWLNETLQANTEGIVSHYVLKRLADVPKFMKTNTRSRWMVGAIFVTLLGLATLAINEAKSAKRETKISKSQQLAAEAMMDLDRHAPSNLLKSLESISISLQADAFSPIESRQLLNNILKETGGTLLRHTAEVDTLAFSPDNRWLATSSANTVRLWDVNAPDKDPIILPSDGKSFKKLAFSPDGQLLVTVGETAEVRLWQMATIKKKPENLLLTSQSGEITDVRFSRDGQWLAIGSKKNLAQIWHLTDPDPAKSSVILPHKQGVNTVAFSPDNHQLATGTDDKKVYLWTFPTNTLLKPIIKDVPESVWKVAFSPNGQWLVAGATENYHVLLWRVKALDKRFDLKVNQHVWTVDFSPDGRWLATPSQYDAKLWDLNKDDPSIEPITLPGHKDYMADLAFSSDGKWFATGSGDYTSHIWNRADPSAPVLVLSGHEDAVTSIAFSPDNRYLATASKDQTVRLWNISSPTLVPLALTTTDASAKLHIWDMRANNLPSVPQVLGRELNEGAGTVYSPNGRWLAVIPPNPTDTVDLWDMKTATPTHYSVPHAGGIWATPVFSPDSRRLVTAGVNDPSIKLWDLTQPDPTVNPQVLRGHNTPIRSLAFSADGRRLVSGGRNPEGIALVWDLTKTDPSENPIRLVAGDIKDVDISPDGCYLVTGSWEPDCSALIWDLSATNPSRAIKTLKFEGPGNLCRVFDVAVSPNGRWAAAGSWNKTTQLVDLQKLAAKPVTVRGHTARILSVAFSPNSHWLATGNEDKTVRLWNLQVDDPSAESVIYNAPSKVGHIAFSPDGHWLAMDASEYRSNPFNHDGSRYAAANSKNWLYRPYLQDLVGLACKTIAQKPTAEQYCGYQDYSVTKAKYFTWLSSDVDYKEPMALGAGNMQ